MSERVDPPPFAPAIEAAIRAIVRDELVRVMADSPALARAIWPTIQRHIDDELAISFRDVVVQIPIDRELLAGLAGVGDTPNPPASPDPPAQS